MAAQDHDQARSGHHALGRGHTLSPEPTTPAESISALDSHHAPPNACPSPRAQPEADWTHSPYQPRALRVPDRLHDLQLLRDLEIINTRTIRALGPLPPGGLLVLPKRKPDLPKPVRILPEMPPMTPPPALLANGLPQPPVPRRLREGLKDHPEYLAQLQEALNAYVSQRARPWRFDGAIWELQERITAIQRTLQADIRTTQEHGNEANASRLTAIRSTISHANRESGWAGDVQDLWDYFQTHADAFARDPAPTLSNGLPPPPIPLRIQEYLKDYPGYLARVQEALNKVLEDPVFGRGSVSMVYEQVTWALEGVLGVFVRDADQELRIAEASGDAEAIAKAKEKDLLVGRASINGMRGMHELSQYLEKYERHFQ